ncbi:sodium:solute symporter family protein [Paludibaculum fermentans]|uniref:Sodium:solute symporter family protein n=1 Tax=Paludibaculum fermentans TaxID=1473598 RepID=A0A7S7NK87_PALFE|nr:sodium:solute symporter family protein [Paludibaculum fermentans]QOY85171.1 sodium:solute symporter family protein [Paludibaculum fermentans]
MTLHLIDYVVLALYFGFVLGIGWFLRKNVKSSSDFLTSGHSLPLWITSLAFLAANMGALEMIGMCGSGAKYGMMTSHFYWVGAIPAMLFVGVFMMPFYYGSKARSVPEYLKLRFDEKTRGFNAITFAIMTIFSSGISMYALGILLQAIFGWSFTFSVLASAGIVLAYTYLGGLSSAIYNEVLQFFLIVAGFAPLAILSVHKAGGWDGIASRLSPKMTQSWQHIAKAGDNPMGVEIIGLIMGLGFVLSFGYWCTNYLVVQRAMAARNMTDARNTPIVGAFPKMFIPFVVIVPGIAAAALASMSVGYALPLKNGNPDYDKVLFSLMAQFYPSGMLGVGLTALVASFMSGMAGNVTAFNTVWTYDIYQSYIRKHAPDEHYLWMGRMATIFGTGLSIGAAYLAQSFNNMMDFLQLIFGFVNAPLFATFLLGMFWKRSTGHGAFAGLVSGTAAAAVTYGLTEAEGKGGWMGAQYHFPSSMAQNFWVAIAAFGCCLVVTTIVSLATKAKPDAELVGLVYSVTPRQTEEAEWYRRPATLAIVASVICIALNFVFF